MTWRAANRLRRVHPKPRPYRVNGFVHAVLATIALLMFFGLLLAAVVFGILLVNTRLAWSEPSPASGASEKTVVQDCTWDALRYCKRAMPQGREAIIHCMILHKDKLKPVCARHLW